MVGSEEEAAGLRLLPLCGLLRTRYDDLYGLDPMICGVGKGGVQIEVLFTRVSRATPCLRWRTSLRASAR